MGAALGLLAFQLEQRASQSNDLSWKMEPTVASVFVCEAAWSEPGMPVRVVVPGLLPPAGFNLDGEMFVTDDTCTHAEASLSGGAT